VQPEANPAKAAWKRRYQTRDQRLFIELRIKG
jgi:hypothetical protein